MQTCNTCTGVACNPIIQNSDTCRATEVCTTIIHIKRLCLPITKTSLIFPNNVFSYWWKQWENIQKHRTQNGWHQVVSYGIASWNYLCDEECIVFNEFNFLSAKLIINRPRNSRRKTSIQPPMENPRITKFTNVDRRLYGFLKRGCRWILCAERWVRQALSSLLPFHFYQYMPSRLPHIFTPNKRKGHWWRNTFIFL